MIHSQNFFPIPRGRGGRRKRGGGIPLHPCVSAERSEAEKGKLTFSRKCIYTIPLEPILSEIPDEGKVVPPPAAAKRRPAHAEKFSFN